MIEKGYEIITEECTCEDDYEKYRGAVEKRNQDIESTNKEFQDFLDEHKPTPFN